MAAQGTASGTREPARSHGIDPVHSTASTGSGRAERTAACRHRPGGRDAPGIPVRRTAAAQHVTAASFWPVDAPGRPDAGAFGIPGSTVDTQFQRLARRPETPGR